MPDKIEIPRNVAIGAGVVVLGAGVWLWWRRRQAAAAQDQTAAQGAYSGAFAPVPATGYGANFDEIITTVNGPSAGEDDDDDARKPGHHKRRPPKRTGP